MTKFLIFTVVGVLALVVRDLLFFTFPVCGFAPDLLLITVLYLGIFRNPIRGVLIVAVLGYLADLTSAGGCVGLSSLAYIALFLFARLVGRVFYARNPVIQGIIVVVGTVAYSFAVHEILREFGLFGGLWPSGTGRIAVQAVLNGAVAPPVFFALFRVEALVLYFSSREPELGRQRADRSGWIR